MVIYTVYYTVYIIHPRTHTALFNLLTKLTNQQQQKWTFTDRILMIWFCD